MNRFEHELHLTRDELLARLEAEAQRRRVRLSARELVRQARAGAIDDPIPVLILADLLAEDDPLFDPEHPKGETS